jgi:hypothetical protein
MWQITPSSLQLQSNSSSLSRVKHPALVALVFTASAFLCKSNHGAYIFLHNLKTSSEAQPASYIIGCIPKGEGARELEANHCLHLVPRLTVVELCIHSPIRLDGVVLYLLLLLLLLILILCGPYSPWWISASVLQFLNHTDGRTPWATQTSMPGIGSKPTKTVHALDTAATVIGA